MQPKPSSSLGIVVQYKLIPKQVALLNDTVAGAYVINVIPGSSADKAGIKSGDIITKVDGKDLSADDQTSLSSIISMHKIGDQLKFDVVRDGKQQEVMVTLQEGGQ